MDTEEELDQMDAVTSNSQQVELGCLLKPRPTTVHT